MAVHRGRGKAAALTAWRAAVSLFTVLPVAGPAQIDRAAARRALLLLPVVGVLLGGVAAVLRYAVGDALLAAVLAVGSLALLTGGLHLDGLADTADGLGSRRPAVDALAIMRKSDIGPMGVAAVLFCVLAQVAALADVRLAWVAVLVAAVVARTAVLACAGQPAARPDGFGALVVGSLGRVTRYGYVAAVLVLAATPAAVGAPVLAARLVGASAAGLLAGGLLCAYSVRRLGGTTGDVYGAVVEVTATTVLVTLAITG